MQQILKNNIQLPLDPIWVHWSPEVDQFNVLEITNLIISDG